MWKWPIAYFLVNKIVSTILCELIRSALNLLRYQYNLRVCSLRFDGDASNCSAINKLGAKIFEEDYRKIKNFFPCSSDENRNIKIILDPCHMVKLGRNALADYKEFISDEGSIKWDYIVKLHNLQKQLNFKLKNRYLLMHKLETKQNKSKICCTNFEFISC